MNLKRYMMLLVAMATGVTSAMASSITFNLEASFEMFQADTTTQVPQGSFYQVWWSADAAYGGVAGNIDPLTAAMTDPSGPSLYGDFVIQSGFIPTAGSWGGGDAAQTYANADVGGATISDGFVYVYVYNDTPGNVGIGDSFVESPIYGPGNNSLPNNGWVDAATVPPNTPNLVDVAPTDQVNMGSHFVVVPEPGTMALFGLGMATLAARRRRK